MINPERKLAMKVFIRRVGAMFIDVNVAAALLAPFAMINAYFDLGGYFVSTFTLVGFLLVMFKDFYRPEGSIGKQYFGLELHFDATLEGTNSDYYRFIRNVPLLCWPLEGLVALCNRGTRIGDILGYSSVRLRT